MQVPLYHVRPNLGGAHQPLPSYYSQPGQPQAAEPMLEGSRQQHAAVPQSIQGLTEGSLPQGGFSVMPDDPAHPGLYL